MKSAAVFRMKYFKMSAPTMNTRKRKAVAKNKKKGWKKVDISELEDFLEDERLQERTGGLASEKADESLFFVDTVQPNTTEEEETSKASLKRHQRKAKPLKCFANLEPDPNTKPAKIIRNIRTRTRPTSEDLLRQGKRKATATEIQADKQRKEAVVNKKRNKVKKWDTSANFDLWEDATEVKEGDEHYRNVTKKRRVNVPSYHYKKPSGLPQVEVPHPGASYNPTYEDHQDLLKQAHEVELKKQKETKRIFNALDAKFPAKGQAPNEETWLEEMSAGLFPDVNREDEVAVPDDDPDKISINPPVRREDLKTRKQRRKERERKMETKRLQRQKHVKIKKNEFNRLKSIKKEISKYEGELEERAKRKAELLEKNKNKTKKLGKVKYVEPEIDLKLGNELTGSLRLLKPEGFLLKDRFHSLQKRNVIETREKAKKPKRRRPKLFEKKSHREVSV